MSGMVSSVAFVCLGSGDREQTYTVLWYIPAGHRGITDSMSMLVVLLVPFGAAAHCFLCFVCAVGGFLIFLEFSAPVFLDLFPWTSQVRLVLSVWSGNTVGGGSSRVGLGPEMLRSISFVSCSFSY